MIRSIEGGVRGRGGDWAARRDGGAYVVEVCPRTEFVFGFAGTTGSTFTPLVQGVPAFDWVAGLLVVRVHALTWAGVSAFAVEVRNVSLSPDDPAIVFGSGTLATPPAAIASGAITSTMTAGSLVNVSLGTTVGPMLEVGLKPTGNAAGTLRVTLSIDLYGRTS